MNRRELFDEWSRTVGGAGYLEALPDLPNSGTERRLDDEARWAFRLWAFRRGHRVGRVTRMDWMALRTGNEEA